MADCLHFWRRWCRFKRQFVDLGKMCHQRKEVLPFHSPLFQPNRFYLFFLASRRPGAYSFFVADSKPRTRTKFLLPANWSLSYHGSEPYSSAPPVYSLEYCRHCGYKLYFYWKADFYGTQIFVWAFQIYPYFSRCLGHFWVPKWSHFRHKLSNLSKAIVLCSNEKLNTSSVGLNQP